MARTARAGRTFPWVVWVLFAGYLGLAGLEFWINQDRQIQDDAALAEIEKARLARPEVIDPARSRDWPQWRGVNRDGVASPEGLLETWPAAGPREKWRIPGGEGFSSCAIAAGSLVTMLQSGEEEVILCVDAETGKERWRHGYPARFSQDGVGPRATPTIDDNLVYTCGPFGHLHCLQLESGKVMWKGDLRQDFGCQPPRWGFSGSPLIDGNRLILSAGGAGKCVVALDKKACLTQQKPVVSWTSLDDPVGYSSPVLCHAAETRQLLVFTGIALVSLEPETGKELWRFPWQTQALANAATPLVLGDYVFISSGYGKGCALLQISRKDGALSVRQVYANNLMRNHFSSSVFHEDHVFGFDEGFLVCLPFRQGKRRDWKERKFNRGTLIVAGGRLLVLSEEGELALVEASADGYRELGLCKVLSGHCWTAPALAQGLLYVRDDQEIVCLDLRK